MGRSYSARGRKESDTNEQLIVRIVSSLLILLAGGVGFGSSPKSASIPCEVTRGSTAGQEPVGKPGA